MTPRRMALTGAWSLSTVAALASIGAWSTVVPPVTRQARTVSRSPGSPALLDTAALAAGARAIQNANPFRVERKPASVRYNPWEPIQPASALPPPAQSRPALVLVGIIGGPPWNALVEGIPGREGGVLLAVGEEWGGIRLLALKGDTVLLSGLDTTWALAPRRVW